LPAGLRFHMASRILPSGIAPTSSCADALASRGICCGSGSIGSANQPGDRTSERIVPNSVAIRQRLLPILTEIADDLWVLPISGIPSRTNCPCGEITGKE